MDEINSMLSRHMAAMQLNKALIEEQPSSKNDLSKEVTSAINDTNKLLRAANSIKTELCKLPLNLCEREYVETCVSPILSTMFFLSLTAYELSGAVLILSSSPIVPAKKSKLKSVIHLIYEINEEVEELFKLLKKRLKPLLNNTSGFCRVI